MADTVTLIANERWKACSGVSFNLGAGLLAAGAAQLWIVGGFAWEGATWILIAIALTWVGWMFLSLLVAET